MNSHPAAASLGRRPSGRSPRRRPARALRLAEFAERFGERFIRIESISELAVGTLRSLDVLDPKVRDVVRGFDGSQVTGLDASDLATTST